MDLSEVLPFADWYAQGEYTREYSSEIEEKYGGVDPIDGGCYGAKCSGVLTRVRSLVFASRALRFRTRALLPYAAPACTTAVCGTELRLALVRRSVSGG